MLIVLSPHLDDAVLSCGATMALAANEGRAVKVVTFFTGEPAAVDERLRVFADYERRKAEDLAALAVVGAEHEWLGYVERAFRHPPLRDPFAVVTTPGSIDGFPNLAAIEGDIGAMLSRPEVTLLAPLAVGNHFDHVEVFLAAMAAMLTSRAFQRVRFYEDPYAMLTRLRRRHFVTARLRWPWWRAPERGSTTMIFIQAMLSRRLRGPAVEDLLSSEARRLRWSHELVMVRDVLHAKLTAISRYESQVRTFGGMRGLSRTIRAYHEVLGGEPLWSVGP